MTLKPLTTTALRPAALAMAGFVLLAGCGSSGTSPSAPASDAPASVPAAGDATVLVADSDLGQILTDAEGLTIYYFANDTEGVSNCSGECLLNWPPVAADGSSEAGDGVSAELGTITRGEGTTQLTVNGFPAYHYIGDGAPGDTSGQGVSNVWWVFAPDGEPIES